LPDEAARLAGGWGLLRKHSDEGAADLNPSELSHDLADRVAVIFSFTTSQSIPKFASGPQDGPEAKRKAGQNRLRRNREQHVGPAALDGAAATG